MIPHGFQYFWIIFGTSNIFTRSGPLHPVFITKIHKKYKRHETSLTHIIFHISTFWKSTISRFFTLPDIKQVELMFSCFVFEWWNLDISLKSGKIIKVKWLRSPEYTNIHNVLLNQTCFWKSIDVVMNVFTILVSPNRSGFPTLSGKKRILEWWYLDKSLNPRIY